jgi:hypothetical protein
VAIADIGGLSLSMLVVCYCHLRDGGKSRPQAYSNFEATSIVTRSMSTENIQRKGTTCSIKGMGNVNLDDHFRII